MSSTPPFLRAQHVLVCHLSSLVHLDRMYLTALRGSPKEIVSIDVRFGSFESLWIDYGSLGFLLYQHAGALMKMHAAESNFRHTVELVAARGESFRRFMEHSKYHGFDSNRGAAAISVEDPRHLSDVTETTKTLLRHYDYTRRAYNEATAALVALPKSAFLQWKPHQPAAAMQTADNGAAAAPDRS